MAFKVANNAVSTLSASATTGATSLTLAAGTGAKFPAVTTASGDEFRATLIRQSDGAYEIVRCTNRSGDVLTVQRAQEGTAALALAVGDRIEARFTKGVFDWLASQIATLISDLADLTTTVAGKQNTITGGASTITSSNLTASRALVSDASGKVAVSAVTSTEVGYLDGVTSSIQTQLNAKANSSVTITAGNGLSGGGSLAANRTLTVDLTQFAAGSAGSMADPRIVVTDGIITGSERRISEAVLKVDFDLMPGPYTGSSSTNTSFPLGTTVLINTTLTGVARNGLVTPGNASGTNYHFNNTENPLSGTWRHRGAAGTGSTATLAQRTA